MSPEAIQRMCKGKVAHRSRAEALRNLHRGTPYGERFKGCRPYLCPICGKWHNGHGR